MELNRNTNGFQLFLKGREIVSHSTDNPWIYCGKGNASYYMHHGNFDIEENLIEKVSLPDYRIEENDGKYTIIFSKSHIYSVKVTIYEENGRVEIRFIDASEGINRLWLRIPSHKDEHIYGCGEQFSYFDLKGRKFPLWVSEQGVGRNKKTYATFMADRESGAGGDYYTTFFPQPTYMSSDRYFCHVWDSSYMEFDFRNDSYHELLIWGVPERITFAAEESFGKLCENLTSMLGRQIDIPDWVYDGVWIGVQGGTEIAKRKFENALSKGLKVKGIWAQDWEGKRITSFGKRLMWNWQWDSKLYPGLDEWIKELNEKNIKFLGYINPYLAEEGNLFREASKEGYLVKNKDNKDYLIDAGEFFIGTVDLTNPEAFKWYKEVIKKYMIGFGLSGWMADFGEYLPVDAVLHNGMAGEKAHNIWPVLWARCNREAIEEAGKLGEIVFFMRSGYSGSGRYSTFTWAGDQNVDWSFDDGIPSVITSALSLGMSGFGLHHSDIGGYTTLYGMKRTKELFLRWAEMAAFTPLMRTHEGNRPDDNWQFDSDNDTLARFARISNVFTCLAPYMKSVVRENTLKGVPVMRPIFMHYDEKWAYEVQNQYMLGRDMLIAPVLEEGKSIWKVHLPEDIWVHLWSGKEYKGGEAEVMAPIGYPPVFYRKSSEYANLFKEIGAL